MAERRGQSSGPIGLRRAARSFAEAAERRSLSGAQTVRLLSRKHARNANSAFFRTFVKTTSRRHGVSGTYNPPIADVYNPPLFSIQTGCLLLFSRTTFCLSRATAFWAGSPPENAKRNSAQIRQNAFSFFRLNRALLRPKFPGSGRQIALFLEFDIGTSCHKKRRFAEVAKGKFARLRHVGIKQFFV